MASAELVRSARRFAARVSLVDSPDTGDPALGNRATLTLLQLPDRRVGITCQHVIEAYREQRRLDRGRTFQVGDLAVDPLDRLIAEDRILDLAVLDLEDTDQARLGSGAHDVRFFQPPRWPPTMAEAGELIGLGGYPSSRSTPSADATASPQASSSSAPIFGTTRVMDVGLENIVCALSEGVWIHGGRPRGTRRWSILGGLSGGPGFVRRKGALHLVGVIFVAAEHGQYIRLRPAGFVGREGTIEPEHAGMPARPVAASREDSWLATTSARR